MQFCEKSDNCHNILIDRFQCLTFSPENVLEKLQFCRKLTFFFQTQTTFCHTFIFPSQIFLQQYNFSSRTKFLSKTNWCKHRSFVQNTNHFNQGFQLTWHLMRKKYKHVWEVAVKACSIWELTFGMHVLMEVTFGMHVLMELTFGMHVAYGIWH